jgi:tryptophan synthase beta chain
MYCCYRTAAVQVSHLYELGLIEAVSVPQKECFDAALKFAQTEGIVSAPEPTHCLAHVIQEALK